VTADALRDKVGDLRQIASVRQIVLGDGDEHGVRALAFSTGGGLDFWALPDHSLDIGPLWWRGRQIAWQAPTGFGHPGRRRGDAEAARGFDLSGFLVTCGLEHIRQPVDGHPLHGRLPFTPARITGHGSDWQRDTPVLFCEGEVIQRHPGGEHFRLRRRIEAPIGGCRLSISDTVENLATTPQRQASLYHFNIGFPGLADGTVVEHAGRRLLGPLSVPDAAASREAASWPVDAAGQAQCTVRALRSADAGPSMTFAWSAETLPHLQLWHDLRPGRCVLGVEPCTSPRLPGGRSGHEPMLEPGEIRRYEIGISVDEHR
jgi:uncharacterized protein DUF4432